MRSSQRRTRQPYGMKGGEPGATGRNTWMKMPRKEDGDLPDQDDGVSADADEKALEPRPINIGGKATVWMGKVS
jgi:5-oxoprolinase (ATP-hydrolysing)